jgi:CheY-like chemotaxis protein
MATEGQAANLASMEGRRVVRMPIADPVYGLSRLLPMTQARDVLLVQEDADLRGVWASALHGAGFVSHPLETVEALCGALLDFRHWRAIVVDLGFQGLEATKFLDRLRADTDAIPTLLTGWDVSILYSESARAFPRLAFRPAPLQPRDLVAAVRALPPPPPAKHLQPSSGMFVVHKPERMLRPVREKGSVLPEAVAARADGEKAAAETRAP